MNRLNRKILGMVCGVLLAGGLLVAPLASANELDQSCEFTFSQPIQIPDNTVLPSGTYWFTMLNAANGQSLVRISSADGTHDYAILNTIEVDRYNATDLPQLKFADLSANQPEALINWFYPGRLAGHEFIYPRSLENRISESQQLTVMAKPVPLTYRDWLVGTAS